MLKILHMFANFISDWHLRILPINFIAFTQFTLLQLQTNADTL